MARDLHSWPGDLGLGKYFEIFVANDVDFDLLTELEDHHHGSRPADAADP